MESHSVHLKASKQDDKAIAEVQKIMRLKGFPEPNVSDALRFALLDCIANHGKKVSK